MRFFLLLSFFVSAYSHATDYYWSGSSTGVPPHYEQPTQYCEYMNGRPYNTSGWTYVYKGGGTYLSDIQFQCNMNVKSTTGNETPNGGVRAYRFGTSCALPKVYNPVTRSCETPPDQCAEKEGDSEPFNKSGPRGDGYYSTVKTSSGTLGVTPDSACFNGCAVNLNQACVYTISADRYYCTGTAYFTGQSCTVGDSPVDTDPLPRDVEPEITNDEEPCVYVQDGEGRMVCVSKQVTEEDGQNCGTAGPPGAEVRVCRPKEAKKDEKKTETEVEEKPTPDGGTETVKKDVHTETKCHGSPTNCTTTTTTTTTTTKKDGSGTTTKTEVKCTGPKCGDDGKGGSGGGGGGGSGNGDGDGEGDIGTGNLPGNDNVPGFGESLGNFTGKIQGSPIVSAVSAISFPSGGSCNMGSANVYLIGSISFDWFCQNANVLDPLYYVMLGIWALGAVRLFMEA